ncbi:MAG: hypothetical protein JHC52_05990, partial [Chthoniobacterales bacterium]|nr:hypothetical protein [Chthoniobacterales bacterium]
MNDPRITSYALGELEGPAREQFERALAESEELQRHVSETTHFSKILGDLPMPTEQLEDEQRTALLASCAKNQKAKRRNKKIFFLTITPVLAAAACLVLAFLVGGPGLRLGSSPWANAPNPLACAEYQVADSLAEYGVGNPPRIARQEAHASLDLQRIARQEARASRRADFNKAWFNKVMEENTSLPSKVQRPSLQEFNTEAYAAVNENDFLS